MPATWPRSSSSSRPASSRTSRNARAGPRTRTTAAASRRSAGTGTCECETERRIAETESSAGNVARGFLALGAGEAVSRLIAFGATIYAARVLGPAAYGVLGVATAVVLYLNRIAD